MINSQSSTLILPAVIFQTMAHWINYMMYVAKLVFKIGDIHFAVNTEYLSYV